MVKSVRLDPELASRLERAARAAGVSASEFIREAVNQRCDEVLGRTLAADLAPYIGAVRGGGGRASHSRQAFREALGARAARRQPA